MKNQKKAYIFAFMSVACWATVGSAFKITLRYADTYQLVTYSSFVAMLVLLLWLSIQKNGFSRILKTTKKQILRSAFLGFLNPFLYYLILFKAYSLLLAQEAVALNYLWPIMLVLLSIPLLKQRIGIKNVMALLVSFSGTLLIATGGKLREMHFSEPVGVSLALLSTIIWALYWIMNMKDTRDELPKLFWNFLFGFVYSVITLLLFSKFQPDNIKAITGMVYIGLFEMGITFVLWLKALKYSVTTAKVSNLIYLSPFLSLIIVHFAVGEPILPSTLAGLGLIISGILFQQYVSAKNT
ncbi:MAG: DMT family transporter [Lentimicrobiaceae bacterium]|jgi:drug/metabolite transporter (DMT)-like permease|nr:DMT family transporter [Lentimicrobiaceae bacterium]